MFFDIPLLRFGEVFFVEFAKRRADQPRRAQTDNTIGLLRKETEFPVRIGFPKPIGTHFREVAKACFANRLSLRRVDQVGSHFLQRQGQFIDFVLSIGTQFVPRQRKRRVEVVGAKAAGEIG